MSGISSYIDRQRIRMAYENVYAGIIIIGVVGLVTDQVLAWLGRRLFPWTGAPPSRFFAVLRAPFRRFLPVRKTAA